MAEGKGLSRDQALTVAVLTTSQDDVELVNKRLRDSGHRAHCLWVKSPAVLEKTLGEKSIELIILNRDHYPDSIRHVVKQKDAFQPEIPTLAMQLDVTEESILDAMNEGACDLVSTRNADRLMAVVGRELRASRVERALNSTLHSANTYRKQLFEYMEGSVNAIAYVQEGIITSANKAWVDLFGMSKKEDVVGLPIMDNFEPESQAAVKGAVVATMKRKWQIGEKLTVAVRVGDNKRQDLALDFQLVDFDDGDHVQIRITPPEKVQEEPTKLVHDALKRDPATLFYHRSQFIERLGKRLKRKPKSGLHVLVYIRPDDFSEVIRQVGVLNSEEVLAQLAEVLRQRLQPRDVAGRFEGTTIMALLERGSVGDAQVWAQQLVDKLNDTTFEVEKLKAKLTCTIGVCPVSGAFETLNDFVSATVAAHRAGQSSGGNCVAVNEALDEDTKQRKHDALWVQRIKSALVDKRFRLAKLPIAGLRNDGKVMSDTLVRMIDEQGEAVLPSEFLPAAERNNLLKTIDRWMIGAAMEFCKAEDADRVFVRLSSHSMRDGTLAEWLNGQIANHAIRPDQLCLQVAEKEAARHIREVGRLVAALRQLGVAFALEHYGVTKGRLKILDLLKPDYIKVDGEMMFTLMNDMKVQQQVQSVITEADKRGIETIAERVENANAMAVLFQLGVHYMQGHYVHEPEVVLQEPETGGTTGLEALASA